MRQITSQWHQVIVFIIFNKKQHHVTIMLANIRWICINIYQAIIILYF